MKLLAGLGCLSMIVSAALPPWVPAALSQFPNANLVTALDPLAGLEAQTMGKAECRQSWVEVIGQPFGRALRVEVLRPGEADYQVQLRWGASQALSSEDRLLAVFWVRTVESYNESGEGTVTLLFEEKGGQWRKYLSMGIPVSRVWQRIVMAFPVRDAYPAGGTHLGLNLGARRQSLEIGPVALYYFGKSIALADLQKLQTRLTYPGREAEAPWRKAAAERIARVRQGDFQLQVVDRERRPIPRAEVQATLVRHAFAFGTAVDDPLFSGRSEAGNYYGYGNRTLDPGEPAGKSLIAEYTNRLARYFNLVVPENSMKSQRWPESKNRDLALKTVEALDRLGLDVKGHCLVWPSWQFSHRSLRALSNDTPALGTWISNHIDSIVGAMRGKLAYWDVANELYSEHEVIDLLGTNAVYDWFRQARALDPRPKLLINDYRILAGDEAAKRDWYFNFISEMKAKGVPIDGIGFQSHFGGSPTGIEEVLRRLDRFAALGLELWVTEFDVNTKDESLCGDYLRDFYTACYSHPAVKGIMAWGFWEEAHWLPDAAWFRRDWSAKPAGESYLGLVHGAWKTRTNGLTAGEGRYAFRGTFGRYEVLVRHGAQERRVVVDLSKPGAQAQVILDAALPSVPSEAPLPRGALALPRETQIQFQAPPEAERKGFGGSWLGGGKEFRVITGEKGSMLLASPACPEAPPTGGKFLFSSAAQGGKCLMPLAERVGSGSAWWSVVAPDWKTLDVSAMGRLGFYVRVPAEGMRATLQVSLSSGKEAKTKLVSLESYLKAGSITSQWQRVSIPLADFPDLDQVDLRALKDVGGVLAGPKGFVGVQIDHLGFEP
jgi:GH35 family endo-1,4-beta-xylanase